MRYGHKLRELFSTNGTCFAPVVRSRQLSLCGKCTLELLDSILTLVFVSVEMLGDGAAGLTNMRAGFGSGRRVKLLSTRRI